MAVNCTCERRRTRHLVGDCAGDDCHRSARADRARPFVPRIRSIMNDKFNDDDFSWLSDPDDPDKKKDSSQDDESFSWQQSDESRRTDQSGPRSGVTGQLSWQKDESATGDDESADDDEGFA